MRVVLGGTFEYMHRGHRALLKRAFEMGDEITIGVTADGFKPGVKKSIEERVKNIRNFADKFGKKYRIEIIDDIYGPTLSEEFDIIVVSPESRKNAEKINRERKKKGLKDLKIEEIPMYLAEDLLPISSRRIRDGKIDENGKRLVPLRVAVGSENPSKINAVKNVFEEIFSFPIEIEGKGVNSGVPPQPMGEETLRGAMNRAREAMSDEDYSVGIEAGLFWEEVMNEYVDRAYCVIRDSYGRITFGHSGGFTYPEEIIKMVHEGMEVGHAMEKISGIEKIKTGIGAIGFLSNGKIMREEFNAQAVLMAMIPRIGSEYYINAVQGTRTL